MLKTDRFGNPAIDLTIPGGAISLALYEPAEDRLVLTMSRFLVVGGSKMVRRIIEADGLRQMTWSLDFLGFQLCGLAQELLDLPTLAGCGEPADYSEQIRPLWEVAMQGRRDADGTG